MTQSLIRPESSLRIVKQQKKKSLSDCVISQSLTLLIMPPHRVKKKKKFPKPDYFAGLEFEDTDFWSRMRQAYELCYCPSSWKEIDTKLSNECRSLSVVTKMVRKVPL